MAISWLRSYYIVSTQQRISSGCTKRRKGQPLFVRAPGLMVKRSSLGSRWEARIYSEIGRHKDLFKRNYEQEHS